MTEAVAETPGLIETMIQHDPTLGALALILFIILAMIFVFVIWVMKHLFKMNSVNVEAMGNVATSMQALKDKVNESLRFCRYHQQQGGDGPNEKP